ncbi:hypothetical protein NHX12_014028, partial [Muraenolepis orangiensis]
MEEPDPKPHPLWEPQTHSPGWGLCPTHTWTDPGYTTTGSEPSLLFSPERPDPFRMMLCLRPWWPTYLPSAEPTGFLRDRTPTPGEHLSGAPVVEIQTSQQRTNFPDALQYPWSGEPSSPGLVPLSSSVKSNTSTAMFPSSYSWYSPGMVSPVMMHSSWFNLPLSTPFSSFQETMEMAPPRGATYNPLNPEQIHDGDLPASQRPSLRLLQQCTQSPAMLDPQPDVSCSFTASVVDQPPLARTPSSPLTSRCLTKRRTQSFPSSRYRGDRAGSEIFTARRQLSFQPDISQTSVESSKVNLNPDLPESLSLLLPVSFALQPASQLLGCPGDQDERCLELRDWSKVIQEYRDTSEEDRTAAAEREHGSAAQSNDQTGKTSAGDESGVVEANVWETPRRDRRPRPWLSALDDMVFQCCTESGGCPIVPQIPEGSEILDGEAGGDGDNHGDEEMSSCLFTEYLDEEFVSMVGSILDVEYLESLLSSDPEPMDLIRLGHGEMFQADQTPAEVTSGDDGAISKSDSTDSPAEVFLPEVNQFCLLMFTVGESEQEMVDASLGAEGTDHFDHSIAIVVDDLKYDVGDDERMATLVNKYPFSSLLTHFNLTSQ